MRVAVDISQIIYGSGVSVYTKKLITGLLAIDQADEFILFGGSLRRFNELKHIANSFKGRYSTKIFGFPPSLADLVWNRLHVFPIEKLVGPVDVLHTSDWTQPPTSAFRVTTVHDLIPIKFSRF